MIRKLQITSAVAGALLLCAGAVQAQSPASSRETLSKALEQFAAKAKPALQAEQGPAGKAVSRTDKAEATFIGRIELVDSIDFLDDGTPFRIVVVDANRPIEQFHYIVCLGSSAASTCGRLIEGRRIQFTADVLTIDEGESAGLALFIGKKIKT